MKLSKFQYLRTSNFSKNLKKLTKNFKENNQRACISFSKSFRKLGITLVNTCKSLKFIINKLNIHKKKLI